MRFGNIRYDGVIRKVESGARIVNIGDGAQFSAIDMLYQRMGIDEVNTINFFDIMSYDGEYTIVPVNGLSFPDSLFNWMDFSDRIIPVYIAFALANFNLSQKQLQHLKQFEPIGCRDERTMRFLRSKGITAYLFGCLAGTHPKTSIPIEKRKTIFFIDAPKSLLPYIPKHMYRDICFLEHELYITLDEWGEDSGKQYAMQRIERYRQEARLIVTSRYHGAILGLALGIPTIIVLENNSFRWSWVSKYLPLYTRDHFMEIDWNVKSVDFEPIKARMLDVAQKRVWEAYKKYNELYSLSYLQENKMRCDASNLLYYSSALEELDRKWQDSPEPSYILWGAGENAKYIYPYISQKYPEARLVGVYDYYAPGREFQGIVATVPTEEICLKDKKIFTIVTSNSAKHMASDLFERIEKSRDKYILCTLDILSAGDLRL